AYSTGSLFPTSFNYWERAIELDVDETYYSEILSNYYTETDVYVSILVTEPDLVVRPEVSFYLLDMNMMSTKHLSGNYSDHLLHFRLPYLFSDFPFIPAWWAIVLENSLYGDMITVTLRVSSGQFEDSGIASAVWIQNINAMPLFVLASVWVITIGFQIYDRIKTSKAATE
ncbi:MAG: hypothetical protein ACFFEJ_05320, partial [Candidatus Thorarchaeota archaeon]